MALPVQFFFQNDQLLNIYQENIKFFLVGWIVVEFSEKNICYSLPIPKIKFDPPPQGKNDLVFIF